MGTVEFDVFDADNHYYEATDAFIRHLPKHRSKLVQWAEIDGKQRMIVDNKIFPSSRIPPSTRLRGPDVSTSTSGASRPATTSVPRSVRSSRSVPRIATRPRA